MTNNDVMAVVTAVGQQVNRLLEAMRQMQGAIGVQQQQLDDLAVGQAEMLDLLAGMSSRTPGDINSPTCACMRVKDYIMTDSTLVESGNGIMTDLSQNKSNNLFYSEFDTEEKRNSLDKDYVFRARTHARIHARTHMREDTPLPGKPDAKFAAEEIALDELVADFLANTGRAVRLAKRGESDENRTSLAALLAICEGDIEWAKRTLRQSFRLATQAGYRVSGPVSCSGFFRKSAETERHNDRNAEGLRVLKI